MSWVYNASPEVNKESQYPKILAVCIPLSVFMVVVVSLRLWIRMVIRKSFGTDDVVLILSALCGIIYSALCITQSRYGLGLPLSLRPEENLERYATVNFAGRPFYMVGITGFKLSLCIAYLRILKQSTHKFYRHVVWSIIIFIVVSHLVGTLVLMFQCTPVQRSWRPLTPGTCLPDEAVFYTLAGISIFCDMVVYLTPVPLWIKVQMSLRQKIGLIAGFFLLGAFITVCSIIRTLQIDEIAKTGNSTMLILWGIIELNVGVSITCIPMLIPLLALFRSANRARTACEYPLNTEARNTGDSVPLEPIGEISPSEMRYPPAVKVSKAGSSGS